MKWAFQIAQCIKISSANSGDAGDRVHALGWEDPLEKEMAIHSCIVAWKTLWTKEPGGLQSMGSQSQTRLK